jgi:hypothetical protein
MTPESILKRQICEYLARFPESFCFSLTPGITASKKIQRSKYMPNGWPDITGVWKRWVRVNDSGSVEISVPFFIEVKIRPKKPTEDQEALLKKLSDWGCVAMVAYDLSDVVNRFHGHQSHQT